MDKFTILMFGIIMLIALYGVYDASFGNLKDKPNISFNITGCGEGMVIGSGMGEEPGFCFGGCFYEGRQYGCFRDLQKQLHKTEIK